MIEDRPYLEKRGAWKKVKGDFDYDGPQKLANLSCMWEKMVGKSQGIILEWNDRLLQEIVKGCGDMCESKTCQKLPYRDEEMQEVWHRILQCFCPCHLQI